MRELLLISIVHKIDSKEEGLLLKRQFKGTKKEIVSLQSS